MYPALVVNRTRPADTGVSDPRVSTRAEGMARSADQVRSRNAPMMDEIFGRPMRRVADRTAWRMPTVPFRPAARFTDSLAREEFPDDTGHAFGIALVHAEVVDSRDGMAFAVRQGGRE